MSFLTIVFNALANAAEEVEENAIEEALQIEHDKDEKAWAITCEALEHAASRLGTLPVKSKFVEALISGLGDAVADSKAKNTPPDSDSKGHPTV